MPSRTVQPCLSGSCTTIDRLRGGAFMPRSREIRRLRDSAAGLRQHLRMRGTSATKLRLCAGDPGELIQVGVPCETHSCHYAAQIPKRRANLRARWWAYHSRLAWLAANRRFRDPSGIVPLLQGVLLAVITKAGNAAIRYSNSGAVKNRPVSARMWADAQDEHVVPVGGGSQFNGNLFSPEGRFRLQIWG